MFSPSAPPKKAKTTTTKTGLKSNGMIKISW